MIDVGSILLSLAFTTALLAAGSLLLGQWRLEPKAMRAGLRLALAHAALVTLSVITLLYYLVTRDFQVTYVAMYTDKSLPLPFTMAALWAGQSGSLLFWAWLLSLIMAAFIALEKRDAITSYAVAIMASVNVFFTGFLLTLSNPFERLAFTPQDGMGLNPLLQNHGMLLHPPTLLAGYATLTVPYALAMAGLLADSEFWVFRARRWTLIGWLFLTLGILIGAAWSYVVLGWGGYWAWDPVENSSLIPWLIATALLHSVMVQESRRAMKFWNVLLAVFTFEAVVFATFMTRSGVIASVHAFTVGGVGPAFTWYLLAMLGVSIAVVAHRYESLLGGEVAESAVSREFSFLLNNLALVTMTVTVFWGTVYPLLSEALVGARITVGPGFYELVFKPLLVGVIALMGYCAMLKWRRTERGVIISRAAASLAGGSIAALLALAGGFADPLVVTGYFAGGFAVSSHALDFMADLKALRLGSRIRGALRLVLTRRRKYGGYIIHVGVVLLFLGYMTSSAFTSSFSTSLEVGNATSVDGYILALRDIRVVNSTVRTEIIAEVEVRDPAGSSRIMRPAILHYPKFGSTVGRVDIWAKVDGDVYLILQAVNDGTAKIAVKFLPLVSLIWVGGFALMTTGLLIAVMPRKVAKRLVGG